MTFTTSNFLLLAAIILIFSILVTKTGYKFGVPSLLIFLIVGMIFGEDGLGIHYDNYHLAQFIGMIALTIILFTGGMDTRFNDIRPIMGPGLVLSTVGVLLTTIFTGLFIFGVGQVFNNAITLPLTFAILLAATMSSTDSASVFSIIRSQKMKMHHNLQPLLELESGSNDPMAYMLTIVMIQVIQNRGGSDISVLSIIITFFIQFALGFFNGYVFGRIYVWIHNKLKLENRALYQILIVGFIFLTFSITDALGGNGYLAVYIAGIVTGNAGLKVGKELKIKNFHFTWFGTNKLIEKRNIEKLLDGMVWMVQIIMFLNLGLLVNPTEMLDIAVPAIIIGVFVIIIGRPLAVWLSLIPFKNITAKDKIFVSWVGLRGAAPIIFATYPMVEGVEGGKFIFNIVFFITLLSLVIQGTTIPFMARKLKLGDTDNSSPENFGVEIPDEINALMQMQTVENEAYLKDYPLPQGTLVMFVKRNNNYLVPNGSIFLKKGDEILLVSKDNEPEIIDDLKK
ncbi:MAG: potassium/proton antiporter [Candidatus Limimorpha sp.]